MGDDWPLANHLSGMSGYRRNGRPGERSEMGPAGTGGGMPGRIRMRWLRRFEHDPAWEAAGRVPNVDCATRPRKPADLGWPSGLYRDAFEDPHRAAHILQLLLSSQAWVHRRVEAMIFHDGTTATRRVSVDFTLPSQAPVCEVCARWPQADDHRGRGGSATPSPVAAPRLVPITLLPKRSLINFDLRDETGAALPHLELRQNQDLTFTLLSIWARHVLSTQPVERPATAANGGRRLLPPLVELQDEVANTLCTLTYGTREEFESALACLKEPGAGAGSQLRRLANDQRFQYVLGLLAYDFMLVVEVPDGLPYRHVYKVSYDTSFRPKHHLAPPHDSTATISKRLRSWGQKRLTAFGLRDTSFEFDTPEAKLAQSYHLKVQVPESVEISTAVLLAGPRDPHAAKSGSSRRERPREPSDPAERKRFHFDTAGGRPMVDLHVVEVDPDLEVRARVDVKARRSGWLGSAFVAGLIAFAAVFLVSRQLGALSPVLHPPARSPDPEDLTLLATTLAGLSALLATMLTRPSEHPMASELLYWLRPLSSLAMLLPTAAAAVIIFTQRPQRPLAAITTLSALLAVVLALAWWMARRHGLSIESPWHQDAPTRQPMIDGHRSLRSRFPWERGRHGHGRPGSYQEAWDRYEFAAPAVETEHPRYQAPMGGSAQDEAAELVRRFDQGGCPGQMTGPAPRRVSS
jgi:hypothetical protein